MSPGACTETIWYDFISIISLHSLSLKTLSPWNLLRILMAPLQRVHCYEFAEILMNTSAICFAIIIQIILVVRPLSFMLPNCKQFSLLVGFYVVCIISAVLFCPGLVLVG